MTATVFIINGYPRAGKDTLAEFMDKAFTRLGYACSHYSSIDPVRNTLTAMGIDVSAKTAADRKLLATIGAEVEKHSHFRSKGCVDAVQRAFLTTPSPVVFMMIREPEIIERVKRMLEDRGHLVFRILMHSHYAEIPTNPTDRMVMSMNYDILVSNHGTLQHLAQEAQALVNLVHMRQEVRHVG